MSVVTSKKPDWEEVLNGKARLVHQQIASLQRWVEQAGGGDELLEQLCAPYYDLLRSIYAEDFPLAFLGHKPSSVAPVPPLGVKLPTKVTAPRKKQDVRIKTAKAH